MKRKANLITLAAMAMVLASCGTTPASSAVPSSSAPEVVSSEAPSLVDYAASTHLDAKYNDYASKNFLTDGYGRVDLVRKIDGDTAHFYVHGTKTNLIKSRYNCIDTPESTGMLEPWGHGASERNGELLFLPLG